ncbi:MAG TPA: N-formylglutamate deformylase [Steroidobacteraceae bacterium]
MADSDASVFQLNPGRTPLIVSMPHVGTRVPEHLEREFTPVARALVDTDWNVDRLYDFVSELGAHVIAARYSRYVIDLNRPPDSAPLYPGMTNTGLCPTHTFAGEPLYGSGVDALPASEVDARRERYWQPYHQALAQLIQEVRANFGFALLYDAHSVRSRVPRLFTGILPDINVGTDEGASCHPDMIIPMFNLISSQTHFSCVVNGRFKGGYITRQYGAPAKSVHAVQIELTQSAYMDEDRTVYDETRASPLRELLQRMLNALIQFVPPAASK